AFEILLTAASGSTYFIKPAMDTPSGPQNTLKLIQNSIKANIQEESPNDPYMVFQQTIDKMNTALNATIEDNTQSKQAQKMIYSMALISDKSIF
ncbi:7575_t:CDS:2, partial [Gigaspora rosea]